MKNITLNTTIKEALEILNAGTADLKKTWFNNYTTFHSLVRQCFNTANTPCLMDGLNLRTWNIDCDTIDIFEYSKDVKEDMRTSEYNRSGKINSITFSVVSTWYNHNTGQLEPLPPHSENWTIEQLLQNRRLFNKEKSLAYQMEYIKTLNKDLFNAYEHLNTLFTQIGELAKTAPVLTEDEQLKILENSL